MTRTVADDLWTMLAQAGVKRVYGIVGDALDPTFDAFRRHTDQIEFIHVRHEEWGHFAANAEAFFSEGPVVVCGTAGPGLTHLVNGLLDGLHERLPVIAIAGDVETTLIGTAYVEEVNPKDLFQTGSLYTGRVISPNNAQLIFAKAIRTAILEEGPTVIALPGDIAMHKAEGPKPNLVVPQVPKAAPLDNDLKKIAEMVNSADKVTIFGGDGCRHAKESTIELAKKLKAPIGYSFKGKAWLEAENEYAVGMTGFLGYGGCFDAVKDADVVLMLGTDFPLPDFLSEGDAKIVQVDKNPHFLGRKLTIAAGSASDVDLFNKALLPLVDEKTDDAHLKKATDITEKWAKELDHYADHDGSKPIDPRYVAHTLNKMMDDDAILTFDVGTECIWVARHMTMSGKRMMFSSLSWASMATASPNAFGATRVFPDRQVVAFCGDGGFSMLGISDLLTEVHFGANIVHVINNNSCLGFVNIEMQEAGMEPIAVDIPATNYAKIAEGIGAKGIRVEDPKDLESALKEAFEHKGGPVVVDVVCDKAALSMPSHVPAKTAVGFTISAIKQFFGGDAHNIIAEADHNYKLLDV